MPEENTWDTASVEPVAPAPEIPTVADPPAPAPALENPEPAPLDAAPAPPRESESQDPVTPEPEKPKDEYEAEADDPAEIAALPTPAAKRWAKRQFQDALPSRLFTDFEKPIKDFGDELFKRSTSRYRELVDDMASNHQDYLSQKLFGVPYDQAKSKLQPNAPVTPTPTPASASVPSTLPVTPDELEGLSVEEVTQRLTQFQTTQAEEKAALRQEIENLKQQFEAVSGEFTTQKQQGVQNTIIEKGNELHGKVWSVVEDGIRNSGLEAQANDPPKIASLKKAAARLLDKSQIEAAFDASDENKKLVGNVIEAIKRGEFQTAFREEDNLKVRARAAFESVKQSPEVRAILDEIEAYANQSKGNSRGDNPIPPAPGSSVGITIKPPTTWDEAVAGAPS